MLVHRTGRAPRPRTGGPGIYQLWLGPGELVLDDASRPLLAPCGLLLAFPRALLPLPERRVRPLVPLRLPGDRGVGALLTQFVLTLAAHGRELTEADAPRLTAVLMDLLAAVIEHAPGDATHPLVRQAYAHIEAHLHDPALTPGQVAAACSISTRYLHRLFQREGGTVSGMIRRRRLERCRRDLAGGDPSIAAVAARWGFRDAAQFSRAFRSAYGMPPSLYRQSVR
ncbi:helix-turn-helix domain-containing protein [Nonomuraea soli]|uniref:AraC-like DNA-binding protein n=1 Tax=Nonomuraea soli TaxID=1032476 RepID=A0A7W0CGD8_9ACTN|nr:helix-turn-helix domain-containing protein [Nonomuraea soli]MBA2890689.1 AraC-like DNA-binding protein [Nonomuraea soli]